MLPHHELASPWILASLHELNCNPMCLWHNYSYVAQVHLVSLVLCTLLTCRRAATEQSARASLWVNSQIRFRLIIMPQAIHERTAFYSCNRAVAIHCVIVRTNAIWAKPKSIYKQKRENKTVYPKSSIFFCWFNEIAAKPRWNLRSAQMKSKVKTLDEIKSVGLQPREAGFHRESDFIHQRWISPVEDGFDCVLSLTENTHTGLRCLSNETEFESRSSSTRKTKAPDLTVGGFLELLPRFELGTSSLPRMCSTNWAIAAYHKNISSWRRLL